MEPKAFVGGFWNLTKHPKSLFSTFYKKLGFWVPKRDQFQKKLVSKG
jgi:hypothetical protein